MLFIIFWTTQNFDFQKALQSETRGSRKSQSFETMCDKPKLQNATKDDLNHEKEVEREDVDMVTEEMEKEEISNDQMKKDDQRLDFQMDQELTNRY